MRTRFLTGVFFLVLQIISTGIARFIPERFFCWAPYDEHTKIQSNVYLDSVLLSPEQTSDRYRYRMNGWEPRAVHNIFNLVEQYERTYGQEENTHITIRYRTNGHPVRVWSYPKTAE
jgi:hypothetical protein